MMDFWHSPLLGAYVIPMLGGYTYDSADGLGIDLESTATAEEEGGPPVRNRILDFSAFS